MRRARGLSDLVVFDDRARFAVPGRANHRLARACRGRNASLDKSEQQLLLSFDRGSRRAPCGRNFRIVLRYVSAVEALAHLAGDGRGADFDLLAFYGWAVGVLACTSNCGTVNRARCKDCFDAEFAMVGWRISVCDGFEEIGDVAVYRFGYADVLGPADHLQLLAAHQSRLAAAVSYQSRHHLLHDDDRRAAGEFVDDGDGRDGGAAQRPKENRPVDGRHHDRRIALHRITLTRMI